MEERPDRELQGASQGEDGPSGPPGGLAAKTHEALEKKAKARAAAVEWAIALVLALAITLVLTQVIFVNAQIPSSSMETTIMAGDRVLGYRFAYWNKNPKRLDIIIFPYPDDESQLYVKRVIGMPGDVVEVRGGKVYLNGVGEPLHEPYVNGVPQGDYGPWQVPADAYFVMGDNRNSSWDARFWQNTFVYRNKILGRAGFRIYPNPGKLT